MLLDNAQHLVKRPVPTEQDLLRRFNITVNDALSYGLTSIHDAGFNPISLEFFRRSIEHPFVKIYLTIFIQAGDGRKSSRERSMMLPSCRFTTAHRFEFMG